ncbi:AAA family ATPase [Kiritimatiella glycovorans]|uniref:endopeptidase La n=1 Tax=Kiritimatiella glycovorans TaxID=1307763 RepID=A0A0G3EGV1_9BACT|nr:AAA family ATPase [Kiritimatiella glycovorans]AKJ63354.1 Lon protease [Kiritimatiella glycovorans]
MSRNKHELESADLRRVCDTAHLSFETTADLDPLEGVVGQERALRSVSFGIDIRSPGYHMFAMGPVGTGKTTTIRKFLENDASGQEPPGDWMYVNNFEDPDRPRTLSLPAGRGREFKDDMDELVHELRSEVPQAFEKDEYRKEQERLQQEFEQKRKQLFEALEKEAQQRNFRIVQSAQGIVLSPVKDGETLSPEQISNLDEQTQEQIRSAREELQGKLRDTMREAQKLQQQAREKIRELDRQVVGSAVGHRIDQLKEQYADFEHISEFLDEVRDHILKNVDAFKQLKQMEQMNPQQRAMQAMMQGGGKTPDFSEYRINLLVDNSAREGAPVVLELNPSHPNLIGRIEHTSQFGALVTDFSMIKAGALHRANGGYLMVEAIDVLTRPFAWQSLKQAIKNGEIHIESLGEQFSAMTTRSLKPEPVPLNLKVIMVGDPMIYQLLYQLDRDFQELFKVKADFATDMEWDDQACESYARFVATICREEHLRHFDPSGVAKVVERGSRLCSHQRKVATKFGDVVDLIRQSSYWAGRNGSDTVSGEDVRRAVDEMIYRSNRIEERLRELIEDETILIDTEGRAPGQVNGLGVIMLGDYMFGKPSRITARAWPGKSGVVSIDRETELGGKIHNKGAMILSGYLGGKYADDMPLTLAASITFEQSYEGIDGDSASSTELYALLSELSGFPLRQDLAVTGSVNQRGRIQAIGGVNEKIEGFYDVCRLKDPAGSQGVLIPESNVKHLMLREDVVEAVGRGEFHIYPVSTIDEGIAILTGKEAGEKHEDGSWPKDTVNGAVYARLRELAQKIKNFASGEG